MFKDLFKYDKKNLQGDVLAGFVVGIMLIPQGMAYAMIAGLPPVYGLYVALIPQFIYGMLGSAKQLSLGPVATDAIIISAGLGAISVAGTDEYTGLAMLLSLLVGAFLLIMRLLNLSFIVNFLSRPVISGFTAAAGIIIAVSQLKYLLDIQHERTNNLFESISAIASNVQNVNSTSLIMGVIAMAILVLGKRFIPRFPMMLPVVVVSILITQYLHLDTSVVGTIPEGLPMFGVPDFEVKQPFELIAFAFTLAVIIFIEAAAIGKSFEIKQKEYRINSKQELVAIGVANVIGSFFSAFPASAGFSRTAVNAQAGAKTGLASMISAVLIGISLLFLMPYFYYLPKTILASIIIVSVLKLVDIPVFKLLWRTDRKDFYMLMATLAATLIFGIQIGVLSGVGLSLLMVIYNVSHPHIAVEGRVQGSTEYRNVDRFKELEIYDDILIVRLDAQLFFANMNFFRDKLCNMVAAKGDKLKYVIINSGAINAIDHTAIMMLKDLIEELKEKDITVILADVKGPVRDTLKKGRMLNVIGRKNFHLTVDEAVKSIKGESIDRNEDMILQSNVDED